MHHEEEFDSESNEIQRSAAGSSRRQFLGRLAAFSAGLTVVPSVTRAVPAIEGGPPAKQTAGDQSTVDLSLRINGQTVNLTVDPRVTLLDALRDRIGLTGTKKGCDRGACGACTVHIGNKRVVSCLTLAVMTQGQEIVTIEGLAKDGELHPVQAAFIACDGLQCGYCTPGQIMSAVSCINEGHATSEAEIRESMSGNLCRCGAYPNIVDSIKMAAIKMSQGKDS